VNTEPVSTPRLFFVHVQKTAGTALIMRLRRHFGRSAIYPDESDKGDVAAVVSVEHLLARWREGADRFRVVTGHFPLCTTELLGGGFTTFTVLREPVERTLSYLRHHRELTPADRGRSLDELYEDPFRFHGMIHNHMVKMFSLRADEMTDGMLTRVEFTPARLDDAKRRLATVDVVGVQERFEEFCDELAARFEWRLGAPMHVNRTEPDGVSGELRARIAYDNAMDVELYEFARGLVGKRATQPESRTASTTAARHASSAGY
jgi:Sulfotransferase family